MARDDVQEKATEQEREMTLAALLATLDQPVEASVVRGGYNQLSEYLQRRSATQRRN